MEVEGNAFTGEEVNTYFLSTGNGIYGGAVQKSGHKFGVTPLF